MKEDRAELGVPIVRRGGEAPVHPAMAARFLDQQPAHVVEVRRRVHPAVGHRRTGKAGNPAGHDTERLARGVIVRR